MSGLDDQRLSKKDRKLMSDGTDKGKLMLQLLERMRDVPPLPEEEDYFTNSETLMRFLKAREWKLDEAEKLLKAAVEWRRSTRPLHIDCRWCHDQPGYHALRQVGFDEMGRPVMYSCFTQAAVHRNTVEDSVTHSTYLIENAKRTMPLGVNTWVFVMDCTGISLPACNPRLGYGATQIMSNHYPERLGLVICVNHNAVFQGVWRAIKVFLHPNTTAKMQLVRSKKKIRDVFDRHFSEELSSWLLEEMALNKQKPLVQSQREFWKAPEDKFAHDPRGCPSYVKECVEPCFGKKKDFPLSMHKPHPNIVGVALGEAKSLKNPSPLMTPTEGAQGRDGDVDDDNDSSETEENGTAPELDIDEEFQIPEDAAKIQG